MGNGVDFMMHTSCLAWKAPMMETAFAQNPETLGDYLLLKDTEINQHKMKNIQIQEVKIHVQVLERND
jgi:hypothetical protein